MSATVQKLLEKIKELEELDSTSPSDDNKILIKSLKQKLILANEALQENKKILKS